jgi:hypothetical protein
VSGRRGRRCAAAAALAAGLVASAALPAEPLYVIEQLVVGVSSAPDASGEHIATLKSGDRVELLEREGDQAHVRLANGNEGWVRASYLSADEPLRVRLAQRDAEVARLNDELARLHVQLQTAAAAGTTATGVSGGGASSHAASVPVTRAPSEEPGLPQGGALFNSGDEAPRPWWPWTLATALVGFGLGFGLGALMLDRHIRRKYGGLRIY